MKYHALATLLALSAAGCARTSVALDGPLAAVGDHPVVVVAQAQPAPAQPAAPTDKTGFTFPADKGGQAMSQLLRPAEKLPTVSDVPPGPRSLPAPREVAAPEVTPSASGINPVTALSPKTAVVRPRTLSEAAPLSDRADNPVAPTLIYLDTGARVQVPTRDVNVPVPLVLLGLALPDRVPLDDPTLEASVDAAIAVRPPARTEPVPFTAINLPDPFANAQAVRLRNVPPELAEPIAGTPKPPIPQPTAPPK